MCAVGTTTRFAVGGMTIGELTADNYGQFLMDALEEGTEYEVTIETPGYKKFTAHITPNKSANLGYIVLERE